MSYMIQGAGVQVKYTTIIDARRKELEQSIKNQELLGQKLMEFRQHLRNCKPSQFNEYYELYRP